MTCLDTLDLSLTLALLLGTSSMKIVVVDLELDRGDRNLRSNISISFSKIAILLRTLIISFSSFITVFANNRCTPSHHKTFVCLLFSIFIRFCISFHNITIVVVNVNAGNASIDITTTWG